MGSNNLSSNCEEIGEKRVQKIYFSDHLSSKTDSFVVDMDNISHVMDKDTNANSRITLQRNLSRKGLARNGEMKITGNERDTANNNNMLTTSPRATLHAASTPEKPASVMAVGSTDHSHHQITITTASAANGVAATEAKSIAVKRPSFRRTPPTWSDPRRILIFFATLSIMGTILLIYFTLSIGKLNNGNTNATI